LKADEGDIENDPTDVDNPGLGAIVTTNSWFSSPNCFKVEAISYANVRIHEGWGYYLQPWPGVVKQPMKIFAFNSKSGATLIEVMIALIIIALIILGGGMFFFYGRVNIIREAHRRAALLVASQRLEALKAANWDEIAPEANSGFDPSIRYYLLNSGSWSWIQPAVSGNDPPEEAEETKTVDNLSDGEMVTQAQWVDDDPDDGNDTYDYLKVTVTVNWHDSTTNTVSLTTLIAPH